MAYLVGKVYSHFQNSYIFRLSERHIGRRRMTPGGRNFANKLIGLGGREDAVISEIAAGAKKMNNFPTKTLLEYYLRTILSQEQNDDDARKEKGTSFV